MTGVQACALPICFAVTIGWVGGVCFGVVCVGGVCCVVGAGVGVGVDGVGCCGGVGPMTIATLMTQTVMAAEKAMAT